MLFILVTHLLGFRDIIFGLCTASATQSENVMQNPDSELSSIQITCSATSSTGSATTEESKTSLELTTVNGCTPESPEKNGEVKSNANEDRDASQQSALDELLARVDSEQNGVDKNFDENTVRALAEVLLNQVCLLVNLLLPIFYENYEYKACDLDKTQHSTR